MTPGRLCTKCGHPLDAHTSRGCTIKVGPDECKCYRPEARP